MCIRDRRSTVQPIRIASQRREPPDHPPSRRHSTKPPAFKPPALKPPALAEPAGTPPSTQGTDSLHRHSPSTEGTDSLHRHSQSMQGTDSLHRHSQSTQGTDSPPALAEPAGTRRACRAPLRARGARVCPAGRARAAGIHPQRHPREATLSLPPPPNPGKKLEEYSHIFSKICSLVVAKTS